VEDSQHTSNKSHPDLNGNRGIEIGENTMISTSSSARNEHDDKYTDCNKCHNPLPHCHCKCPYCGQRDNCECALFDAATGG